MFSEEVKEAVEYEEGGGDGWSNTVSQKCERDGGCWSAIKLTGIIVGKGIDVVGGRGRVA